MQVSGAKKKAEQAASMLAIEKLSEHFRCAHVNSLTIRRRGMFVFEKIPSISSKV